MEKDKKSNKIKWKVGLRVLFEYDYQLIVFIRSQSLWAFIRSWRWSFLQMLRVIVRLGLWKASTCSKCSAESSASKQKCGYVATWQEPGGSAP